MTSDYTASNLYEGGWRFEDKFELMEVYELTEEEATKICKELFEIESR